MNLRAFVGIGKPSGKPPVCQNCGEKMGLAQGTKDQFVCPRGCVTVVVRATTKKPSGGMKF